MTTAETFSRSRTRVHFTAPITLRSGERVHAYDSCFDISMNGAFVRTAKPLQLGALARFSLKLSAGMRKEAIEGQCQVVRVVSVDDGLSGENPCPGMGIKFLEFDEDHGQMLYQLVRHNGK